MKNLATLSHDNGEYREELTRKREALAHVEKRLAAIENPEAKAKAAAISSKISSLIEKEKQKREGQERNSADPRNGLDWGWNDQLYYTTEVRSPWQHGLAFRARRYGRL